MSLKLHGRTIKCATCLWWDETQGDMKSLGECRRRAPVAESAMDLLLRDGVQEVAGQIADGPYGRWPWTRADWFCGDHVHRDGDLPDTSTGEAA